ncbi:MAG: DUF2284 domain-containing protein [Oscillospiraceae bacterium]|jgi:predicted metal-binding protein|nr:DUF2284 domain-containing protein [Oscillospiraceae bacterium]
MTTETIISSALEHGFTAAAPLDPKSIDCKTQVRDMCEVCKAYNTTWICPPACGTIEQCSERVLSYPRGVIVQTTGQLEDELDGEGMMEAGRLHGEHVNEFYKHLRGAFKGDEMLALGAGGCVRCEKCTYPDEPCRFPDEQTSSMESYGMLIAEVCKDNNIPYYYGKSTITYVSCYLFK